MAEAIKREFLAHYIDAAEKGATEPDYFWLGDDLENFSVEMSAQVDKKKNIKGKTSVRVSSYEKSGSVEPYYANKGDAIFTRLQNIIDNELTLDDCETTVVDVKLYEDKTGTEYPATREKAVIEVVSYGGDTTGYQIPFKLHYCGGREKGTFNIDERKFTPAVTQIAE